MSDDLAGELRRLLRSGDAGAAAARALAAVGDERPWVRERALSALASLRQTRALLPPLESALRDGGNAARRNAARSALAALAAPGGARAGLRLLERLARHDADGDVRVLAASALGESGHADGRRTLEAVLLDPDPNVSAAAADALGSLGDPRSVDALGAVARGGDPWRALGALFALGRIGAARALPVLADAARDPVLASAAVEAIGELGDPAGIEALRGAAESDDGELRRLALDAAAALLPASGDAPPAWLRAAARREEEPVIARFSSPERPCDTRAALLLGVAGTEGAAAALADAVGDEERGPAAAGALALLPPGVALDVLLPRLERGDAACREELIAALPPLADPASAARVAAHLADADAEVRAVAAEALARALPAAGVRALLAGALADPARRAEAARALGRLEGGACDLLVPLLGDADAHTRRAAAEGLARCPDEGSLAAVRAALARESDPAAVRALAAALGASGGAEAVAPLAALARGGDPGARFAAVRALGRTGAAGALDVLLEVLASDDPLLEAAALAALGELGDARGADALAARLDGGDRDVRRVAAVALRRLAPPAAADRLVRALGDGDWRVRLAAARALERIDAPGAAPALRAAADGDPDPLVRKAAVRALGASA